MFRALPSREDLARIDPFTLGEAVALQLHALDDGELRAFAHTCASRFDGYYRTEIKRALAENPSDDGVLRDAMIAFFRGNPRAIERCEAPFVAATLRATGSATPERSLELDAEETSHRKPFVIAAAIGLVLLGAGAALDRLAYAMHPSASATPDPIVIYMTPAPRPHPVVKHTQRPVVKPQVVAAQPAPAAAYVPAHHVHRYRHPHNVASAPKRVAAAPKRVAAAPKRAATPPAAKPAPKPSPHVAPRTRIRHGPLIRVAVAPSATPAANAPKRSWLQRQLDHLNPFKRHPDVQYKKK